MTRTDNKLALPTGTVLQQYRIEEVLGYGAFGIVYKARHQNLDLEVAIKEYLPQSSATREANTVYPLSEAEESDFRDGLRSFLVEANQLIKFDDHPNVVKCRDFFETNGTAYLVMNFEDGQELGEILRDRQMQTKPLSEQQILSFIVPVLGGLRDIHAVNVLHRDIKPSNIFIRRSTEQPVLIDFGAAKGNFNTHQKSSFVHTEGYGPTEQIEEEGQLGPWTDLYAVGALMWRIIANQNPPKVELRLLAASRGNADPMTSAVEMGKGKYSRRFLEVIDRAVQIHAEDRFQSAAEFISALPSASGDLDEPLTIAVEKKKSPQGTSGAQQSAPPVVVHLGGGGMDTPGLPVPESPIVRPMSTSPMFKLAIATVFVLVVGALGIFMFDRAGPVTAETAIPSEEVVFSKMERMYEQANRVQSKSDVLQGYLVDQKTLEMLIKDAAQSGDSKDYQDTLGQIQRLKSKIQETELMIQHSETDTIEVAFELAKYRKEWGGHIDKLFQEKIKSAEQMGNTGKANLLNGFYLKIKQASPLPDDASIREYLTNQLNLKT